MEKFRVVKIMGGDITVANEKLVLQCVLKGSLKKKDKPSVGDWVLIKPNDFDNNYIIESVLPRKNQLVRPNISNLDQLVIVLSSRPAPDFLLIDKLIIFCLINKILPVLVINKVDLMKEEEINDIVLQYKNVVSDIVVVSGKNKIGLDNLKKILSGKVSAFAGQSAVGKSTLVNALDDSLNLSTNTLSEKINRGKHTTRHCEIFKIDDILIADTPGFSMFDLENLDCKKLYNFYPDFLPFEVECKFGGCAHVNCSSNNCGVVRAVENNKIHLERYERYCKIYNDMKEKWGRKYD